MDQSLFGHFINPEKPIHCPPQDWNTFCEDCKRSWGQYYNELGWKQDSPAEEIETTKVYNSDGESVELEYLTPAMIQIFRTSEIYRLEKEEEERISNLQTLNTREDSTSNDITSFKTEALQKILDHEFNKGVEERKPVLWPVLPMNF
ncbi:hypothetical protein BC833DRAFT_588697 [Globomyces pollinis-pini]|nr:hypothetical protein BC833DRAFT_588697 [Globomyces pollinis-pini]